MCTVVSLIAFSSNGNEEFKGKMYCAVWHGCTEVRANYTAQGKGRAQWWPGQDPFPGKTIQAGDTNQPVEWLPHNVRT